jgi:hypothetical protein
MALRHLTSSSRLHTLGFGLLVFGTVAPIPDTWEKVFSGVAFCILLAYLGASWWELKMDRRQLTGWVLPPVLALGLLSLGSLAPISDLWDKVFSWAGVCVLLAYVGVPWLEYRRALEAERSSKGAISSSDPDVIDDTGFL